MVPSVSRCRLSHRRPESDEYYATYTIRISYFRSGPRHRSPADFQKMSRNLFVESHRKSFKPSPAESDRYLFRNYISQLLDLAAGGVAGGFPKNVQKCVRSVSRSCLTLCRPESDKYYASYTIRISYGSSSPCHRRAAGGFPKKFPEICLESQQNSFKPSPTRIGQISIRSLPPAHL